MSDKEFLKTTSEGLIFLAGEQSIRGDFTKNLKRLTPNNLGAEMLIKAAKPKAVYEKMGLDYAGFLTPGKNTQLTNPDKNHMPLAIDATAGLGEDSLLLAAAGFKVCMYERDEIIAALLEDTLLRAKVEPALSNIVSRMELRKEDSICALKNHTINEHVSIVLLDPMFPERNKSGLVKKKFQVIHTLEKPCEDEEELFEAALFAKPDKIIVKRPSKAPFLSGKSPSYQIIGKVIRYDVYVNN